MSSAVLWAGSLWHSKCLLRTGQATYKNQKQSTFRCTTSLNQAPCKTMSILFDKHRQSTGIIQGRATLICIVLTYSWNDKKLWMFSSVTWSPHQLDVMSQCLHVPAHLSFHLNMYELFSCWLLWRSTQVNMARWGVQVRHYQQSATLLTLPALQAEHSVLLLRPLDRATTVTEVTPDAVWT